MAILSSQSLDRTGVGGVYSKAFAAQANMTMASIPIFSSRTFQNYSNFVVTYPVYTKTLPTYTGVDTGPSHLTKVLLTSPSSPAQTSLLTKVLASSITTPYRPMFGVLWPKGHK